MARAAVTAPVADTEHPIFADPREDMAWAKLADPPMDNQPLAIAGSPLIEIRSPQTSADPTEQVDRKRLRPVTEIVEPATSFPPAETRLPSRAKLLTDIALPIFPASKRESLIAALAVPDTEHELPRAVFAAIEILSPNCDGAETDKPESTVRAPIA